MLHGVFTRGTTPTQIFELPFSTADLLGATVTFSQGNEPLIKKRSHQCVFENNYIITSLSQEESLLFRAGKVAKVQLKVLTKNNKVLASMPYHLGVEEILDEEELT